MIHINPAGEPRRSSDGFSESDALLGNDGVTEGFDECDKSAGCQNATTGTFHSSN